MVVGTRSNVTSTAIRRNWMSINGDNFSLPVSPGKTRALDNNRWLTKKRKKSFQLFSLFASPFIESNRGGARLIFEGGKRGAFIVGRETLVRDPPFEINKRRLAGSSVPRSRL